MYPPVIHIEGARPGVKWFSPAEDNFLRGLIAGSTSTSKNCIFQSWRKFWAANHRQNPLKCHKGLIWQTRKHCGYHLEKEGWSNKVSDRNKKIENSVLLTNEIEKKTKTWEKCYASKKPNIFWCILAEIIMIGVGEHG